MASFVEFSGQNDVIKEVYRPKKAMMQAPRQWWRYAILVTLQQVRRKKKLDMWKLVSEKNEKIFGQLMDELPPIAVRNKKELEALRIEVDMLRKENETLRKIVNDALEPSVRRSPSKDGSSFQESSNFNNSRSTIGGSVTDRVRAFTENDDYVEFNRIISRTTTNNSTLPTVDLENDHEDENSCSSGIIHHEHSSLSIKLRSLAEGSSESTALVPSPYNAANESPYQRTQRLSTMKRNMAGKNRLINRSPRGKRNSPDRDNTVNNQSDLSSTPQNLSNYNDMENPEENIPTIQRYRRSTDINQTRQRTTIAHVQRILKAAEIIMEKVEEELPFSTKYENTEFDTSIPKDGVDKVPAKLPIDERPLSREERSRRAQSIYSPRIVTSQSPSRLVTISEGEHGRTNKNTPSPRKSRKSRSPSTRTKKSSSPDKSRNLNNSADVSEEVIYPMVIDNMSPSKKVAIQIIKEVRFKGRRQDSPVANRPLSKTEKMLLESPFAKPILSPRERESLSPRTRFAATKLKTGRVHDESAIMNNRVQTSKSK